MTKPRVSGKNGFKKAAFKVVVPTKILELTGEGLEGGEAEVRSGASMETYLELKRLVAEGEALYLGQCFGERILIGWNLTDEDDEPLPATGTGMHQLLSSMAISIVLDWFASLEQVPDPLAPDSQNGELSDQGLTALGESSKSLPSSIAQR